MINLPEWLQNTERIFLAIDEPYYIANRQIFNSFSTCFFAPYLDLGYCGVFIFFFIFGYISERLYKRVDLKNEYLVSCFFLVSLMIVLSFFRLLITHYSFALAFIYLFITHKKTKLVAE
jgi:oligosaccharide repeat unit polymerase